MLYLNTVILLCVELLFILIKKIYLTENIVNVVDLRIMYCYKVISILAFVCILISIVACLLGTLSKQWWCGDFEAIVPFYNVTNVPNGYRAHLLFDVRFGLTSVCWGMKQAKIANDSLPHALFPPMKRCINKLPEDNILRNIAKENMKPFRNIFICLIVTIIFASLTFISALIKLPCLKFSRRRIVLLVTLLLTLIAGIAGIVALVIANEKLIYDSPFMKMLLSRPPELTDSRLDNPLATEVLKRIFLKVRYADLSDNFHKGISYDVTCVAVVFIIIACLLTLVEHCCARRSGDDEYNSKLISDGYALRKHEEESIVAM